MVAVKLAPPRLPRVLTPARLRPPRDESKYAGLHLSGGSGDFAADHVEIGTSRLEGVDLARARLANLVVTDCLIERGDLANLAASRCALTRVEVRGSRMTGVHIVDAALVDVTMTEAKLDLAVFRYSKMRRVEFRDCNLTRADFASADIGGARFVGCDLAGAQFSAARAVGAVFEKCLMDGIGGVDSLRGATIIGTEVASLARVFAAALGIEFSE
jgi:uncharacterized protein YjbI with pentapeptide repeats